MSGSHIQRERQVQAYLEERKARDPWLTPSRTFCNSTTSGLYTGNSMKSARDGADQHLQYTGAGFRAQIERTK